MPVAVIADQKGHITEWPGLAAAARSGRSVYPLEKSGLIPLPGSSRLYLLPRRRAAGYNRAGRLERAPEGYSAVAAFLPPGYTAVSLAAFHRGPGAPVLPLYCYCAVSWYRGKFHVPAIRVDHDPKHDPRCFDKRKVDREIDSWLRRYPDNRLVSHHGLICVRRYGCPNAVNLFLGRWEAPVAVSGGCNAACRGCISEQPGEAAVQSPQQRIGFVPTAREIVEIAVPHLEKAPRAMISFGQGCEGEPLLQGDLIGRAIREIRRRTRRGTIHMNTNGSMPAVVEKLARDGLDSIRVSLNSARKELYSAYHRCRGYSFDDVVETLRIARAQGLWVSINYLTFPGVTDAKGEFKALSELLRKTKPDMIQWRNLNVDPDWYMDTVDEVLPPAGPTLMGIPGLMEALHRKFPKIRFGYFNPPVNR
jgi:pyruvate-formate lyase-activating enzyme